jgi:branched-subunit amino acid ABC-type transport system permease component
MNKPSSTITAATIAGMGAALVWELVATFTQVEPTAGLIAGSTAFASAVVGYFKKEKILMAPPGKKLP